MSSVTNIERLQLNK